MRPSVSVERTWMCSLFRVGKRAWLRTSRLEWPHCHCGALYSRCNTKLPTEYFFVVMVCGRMMLNFCLFYFQTRYLLQISSYRYLLQGPGCPEERLPPPGAALKSRRWPWLIHCSLQNTRRTKSELLHKWLSWISMALPTLPSWFDLQEKHTWIGGEKLTSTGCNS